MEKCAVIVCIDTDCDPAEILNNLFLKYDVGAKAYNMPSPCWFSVQKDELAKAAAWMESQQKKLAERQLAQPGGSHKEFIRATGQPYTGAIGGHFSWTFTQTGLGTIVKVKDDVTGEELDLTDYDQW